ncbi:MAG: type II toxin-antitoxin system VapC family toxin [Deltaproteobacteria bacterium]|nr:type II toxin-antitoxin system VapC family toxin [Deltaproteobacteria bacterium]
MKFLLDTQALIFAGSDKLPKTASSALVSSSNQIYFSTVSLWEIGIKSSLGKLIFKRNLIEYKDLLIDDLGFLFLQIDVSHIEKAVHLPWHHKDPFDRLLIGQALIEGLGVIAHDAQFDRYGCKRVWD